MNNNATTAFADFIATQLNNEQRAAVLNTNGPTLVIAGAGSGKTRVITARIAHLILEHNVPGSAIVALTFTNKAAREMKERVHTFIGNRESLPFIGTFHAYCLALLRKNGHLLATPFETILDEDDREKLISTIMKRANLPKEFTARSVGFMISQAKNGFWGELTAAELYHTNGTIREIHSAYEQEKRKSHALDFDDLLLEVAQLFEKEKVFRLTHHSRVRHVLVDEYQDTNNVQHALLKYMALDTANNFAVDSLCAVGDEDQSIYSWRGATIENIRSFQKDFKGTALVKVEQNYRSAQPILEAANSVVRNNSRRTEKNLWSDKKGTDRVRHLVCFSEYQEADMIAQAIKSYRALKPSATIAVLYRTHFQSRSIEEAMLKNALAYQIVGGVQFYERKEIKDILGYARLALNPHDRASFFRVINTPARGLGDKFEEVFYDAWQQEPLVDFRHIISLVAPTQPRLKSLALLAFARIFDGITAQQPAADVFEQIVLKTNYLAYLKENYDTEDAVNRIENVKELINAARHSANNEEKTLTTFLDDVALMQDLINQQKDTPHATTLMSLHAAKGLEFSLVIIAGLEDGLLPSLRGDDDLTDKLEEERRLFYVGMTRAQDFLLCTRARYRNHYRTTSDQSPSRFLEEIPSALIKAEDASHWQTPTARNYFMGWLSTRQGVVLHDTPTIMTFSAPRSDTYEHQEPKEQSSGAHFHRTAASTLHTKNRQFGGTHKATASGSTPSTLSWKKQRSVQHAPSRGPIFGSSTKTSDLNPLSSSSTPCGGSPCAGKPSASLTATTHVSNCPWKKNQPVQHATFGVGIIQLIEEKNSLVTHVTVQFKTGTKKLDARFIKPI